MKDVARLKQIDPALFSKGTDEEVKKLQKQTDAVEAAKIFVSKNLNIHESQIKYCPADGYESAYLAINKSYDYLSLGNNRFNLQVSRHVYINLAKDLRKEVKRVLSELETLKDFCQLITIATRSELDEAQALRKLERLLQEGKNEY